MPSLLELTMSTKSDNDLDNSVSSSESDRETLNIIATYELNNESNPLNPDLNDINLDCEISAKITPIGLTTEPNAIENGTSSGSSINLTNGMTTSSTSTSSVHCGLNENSSSRSCSSIGNNEELLIQNSIENNSEMHQSELSSSSRRSSMSTGNNEIGIELIDNIDETKHDENDTSITLSQQSPTSTVTNLTPSGNEKSRNYSIDLDLLDYFSRRNSYEENLKIFDKESSFEKDGTNDKSKQGNSKFNKSNRQEPIVSNWLAATVGSNTEKPAITNKPSNNKQPRRKLSLFGDMKQSTNDSAVVKQNNSSNKKPEDIYQKLQQKQQIEYPVFKYLSKNLINTLLTKNDTTSTNAVGLNGAKSKDSVSKIVENLLDDLVANVVASISANNRMHQPILKFSNCKVELYQKPTLIKTLINDMSLLKKDTFCCSDLIMELENPFKSIAENPAKHQTIEKEFKNEPELEKKGKFLLRKKNLFVLLNF